ncbi:SRPBCC family protein [Streptomyces sp. NPDC005551]|uniref:SRPBCC family protein n=1 Tax=Streptomyces sp. NPDC005551 TaxID=3364725 RepID=UPI0036CF68CC
MANTQEKSPVDDLKEALTGYLGAMGGKLADKAQDKLGDLTGHLSDTAEGSGPGLLGGVAKRVMGGDSPVKALMMEKGKSVKDNIVEKVTGKKGGSGSKKGSSIKATNIVESIDVGVPVRTAYDHWTQFEDFSSFTKGVRSVSKSGDTESNWKAKIGPSSRGWKATVQEQVADDRIVWTSDGAKGSTRGAVTFHELGPTLTRIVLVIEYYPAGFFEKTGNIWRAVGRRIRLDLKHFARHVTLHGDEELEGWRGEIREGEVVTSHEDAMEEEERREQEGADEDEDAEGEEGEEGADDEDGAEDAYEDEDAEDADEEAEDGEDAEGADQADEDADGYDEDAEYDEEEEPYDEEEDADQGEEDEEEDDEDEEDQPRRRSRARR